MAAVSIDFYDEQGHSEIDGVVTVVRVYRLRWDRFGDAEWRELDRIYQSLPGWIDCRDGPPFWFGTDVNVRPHLTASVEPPGLQVWGLLATSEFHSWHLQFLNAIARLPARDALAQEDVDAPRGHPPLSYAVPGKRPPRNWFWPVLYAFVVIGATVLVIYLQLNRLFEGMKELD